MRAPFRSSGYRGSGPTATGRSGPTTTPTTNPRTAPPGCPRPPAPAPRGPPTRPSRSTRRPARPRSPPAPLARPQFPGGQETPVRPHVLRRGRRDRARDAPAHPIDRLHLTAVPLPRARVRTPERANAAAPSASSRPAADGTGASRPRPVPAPTSPTAPPRPATRRRGPARPGDPSTAAATTRGPPPSPGPRRTRPPESGTTCPPAASRRRTPPGRAGDSRPCAPGADASSRSRSTKTAPVRCPAARPVERRLTGRLGHAELPADVEQDGGFPVVSARASSDAEMVAFMAPSSRTGWPSRPGTATLLGRTAPVTTRTGPAHAAQPIDSRRPARREGRRPAHRASSGNRAVARARARGHAGHGRCPDRHGDGPRSGRDTAPPESNKEHGRREGGREESDDDRRTGFGLPERRDAWQHPAG
ncbi:hypothetical protein SGRIM128S_07120 [Streptomyces griseomycini]